MNFLNEIIVKSENERPNFEFDVIVDHSSDDWCIKEEYIQADAQAFDPERHSMSSGHDNNLQRCIRCNEVLYYDSYSLLQHNLTHLKVMLEKLPDQIFEFYEEPAVPIERNKTYSDSVTCSDIKVESETYYNTSIIKCEVEELNDNSINAFIDTENSNSGIKYKIEETNESIVEYFIDTENLKSDGIYDSNLDIENLEIRKKYKIEEINSDNIMDQFLKDQFIVIENSKRVTKYEEIKENSSDSTNSTDQKPKNVTNSKVVKEIKSKTSMDRFKDLENPKKVIKKDKNNLKKTHKRCHICSKMLSWKQCGQHIKEVHLNKTAQCSICHKEFKCKKTMRTHMKYLHGNMTFQCDDCKSVFTSKDCLQKHMKNVHGKAVYCGICNSRLSSEHYLESHMKRVHYDDGKVHSCEICGKIFKSPRYVQIHMKNSHSVKSKKRNK